MARILPAKFATLGRGVMGDVGNFVNWRYSAIIRAWGFGWVLVIRGLRLLKDPVFRGVARRISRETSSSLIPFECKLLRSVVEK